MSAPRKVRRCLPGLSGLSGQLQQNGDEGFLLGVAEPGQQVIAELIDDGDRGRQEVLARIGQEQPPLPAVAGIVRATQQLATPARRKQGA
jgi:hypothetical protein